MSGNILRSTLQLTLFSFLGIIFGFINQLVLAYYFGTNSDRDVYFTASVIPTYIVAIFVGSVGSIFLSNYIKVKSESEIEGAKFLSVLLIFCFTLLLLISILGVIFSKQILLISAPGFSNNQLILASRILKILFLTTIFQGLISILTAVYQAKANFLLPSFPAIITPCVSIIMLVLLMKNLGIAALALGTLIGYILSFLLLLFPLLEKGNELTFAFSVKNEHLKKLLVYSLPLFVSGIIFRFNTVWERMLASKLPSGSISYLGYSNQILVLMSSITTGGIATIFFPMFSKMWYNKDMIGLKMTFQKGIRILLLIIIPSACLLITLRVNIVHILLRGAFSHNSTIAISNTIAILMGAYFFQSLGSLIFRAFYFMNKTVIASIIGILEVGFYILFSLILLKYYSYLGLAAALSLSAGCNMIITTFFVNKAIKFIDKSLILFFLKIVANSLIVALIIYYIMLISLKFNIVLLTAIYSLVYCITYIVLNYMLQIEEISIILNKTKKLISKYI